eukprot:2199335-Rhodomonas_salina.1
MEGDWKEGRGWGEKEGKGGEEGEGKERKEARGCVRRTVLPLHTCSYFGSSRWPCVNPTCPTARGSCEQCTRPETVAVSSEPHRAQQIACCVFSRMSSRATCPSRKQKETKTKIVDAYLCADDADDALERELDDPEAASCEARDLQRARFGQVDDFHVQVQVLAAKRMVAVDLNVDVVDARDDLSDQTPASEIAKGGRNAPGQRFLTCM